ncbi:MAG TPA: DMT family transporter [Clostridiaceae bacterium]
MKDELKADLSLLFITIFWGTSFPLMSLVLKGIGTFSFIAARNILAGVILLIIFHRKIRKINKVTIEGALLIGISLFIGSAFQVMGLIYTTPSKSGFITGLNLVFVPIIIAVTIKRFPNLRTVLGIILAIIGLAIMSLRGNLSINFGDLLTLLSALCFSFQILFVDKYCKKVDIITLTVLEIFVVGFISLIPGIILEHLEVSLTPFTAFVIIYTAVFCTCIAMLVQNKMQPRTDPTHAAVIYLAEPVFAAMFSIFVGDIMSVRTLIGCMCIFMGMIVISFNISMQSIKYQFRNYFNKPYFNRRYRRRKI